MPSDTCEVRFLPGAERAFRKIGRTDPGRIPFIEDVVGTVLDNGWILSIHSQLIKVLDGQRQVGELRDTGSGGYRLFFFWQDAPPVRILFVTAIEKKSRLKGKARVNEFIDAAAEMRRRYLSETDEP